MTSKRRSLARTLDICLEMLHVQINADFPLGQILHLNLPYCKRQHTMQILERMDNAQPSNVPTEEAE